MMPRRERRRGLDLNIEKFGGGNKRREIVSTEKFAAEGVAVEEGATSVSPNTPPNSDREETWREWFLKNKKL